MESVGTVTRLEALQALAHPARVRILGQLRQPDSAAAVARRLDQPRQRVHYHLKELEKVGLVRAVGERRSGNFVETLYEASARSFVVSPRLVWSDPRRVAAMRDQLSLEQLVAVGEAIQRDAAALLDRAAFDGEQIASVSVSAELGFASPEQRAEFLKAYLRAVGPLLKAYGAGEGERYRVVLAAYPQPPEQTGREQTNPERMET